MADDSPKRFGKDTPRLFFTEQFNSENSDVRADRLLHNLKKHKISKEHNKLSPNSKLKRIYVHTIRKGGKLSERWQELNAMFYDFKLLHERR
jgi:hypothetical protein